MIPESSVGESTHPSEIYTSILALYIEERDKDRERETEGDRERMIERKYPYLVYICNLELQEERYSISYNIKKANSIVYYKQLQNGKWLIQDIKGAGFNLIKILVSFLSAY